MVVLSNSLWRRRFGGDANILGREVALNGQRYTVVGVAPAGFYGTRSRHRLRVLGAACHVGRDHARPGDGRWSQDQAGQSVGDAQCPAQAGSQPRQGRGGGERVKKRLDDTYRKDEKHHESVTLQTAGGLIAGSATPAFTLMAVLMVVVGLVLLVACANVANLLLARAAGRQKEIAIRLAMGAGRRQLVRQLLIESFLLALTGAGVGFLLAAGAARAISNFQLPLPFPVVFDFNVGSARGGVHRRLVAGDRAAVRAGSGAARHAAGPGGSSQRWRRRSLAAWDASGLRNTLVVVQVALSLVLLTTAGLFLRSLGNASSIDIGFKPDNILMMAVDPKLHNYSHEKTVQFLSQLRDRVSALPGVRSVSFVDIVPLSMARTSNNFDVEATKDRPKQTVQANVNSVGSGYFQTMGIPAPARPGLRSSDRRPARGHHQ